MQYLNQKYYEAVKKIKEEKAISDSTKEILNTSLKEFSSMFKA